MTRNLLSMLLLSLFIMSTGLVYADIAVDDGTKALPGDDSPPNVPSSFTPIDDFFNEITPIQIPDDVPQAVREEIQGDIAANDTNITDSQTKITQEHSEVVFAEGQNASLRDRLSNLETQLRSREDIIFANQGNITDAAGAQAALRLNIEEVAKAIEVIQLIDALVQNAQQSTTEQITTRNLNNIRRANYSPPQTKAPGAAAGEFFTDLSLSTGFSFASFHDGAAGGSGHDSANSFFLSGTFADEVQFGLGVSYSEYKIGGGVDLRRRTVVYDFYANHDVTDNLTVGLFLNQSQIDVEDAIIDIPIIGEQNLAQNVDRLGAGVLVSTFAEIKDVNVGITTTVSSSNKISVERLLDNEDAAWATMVDAQKYWTDQFSTVAYATFYTELDNEDEDSDGTFWIVGAEASYAPNDWMDVSLGFERTLKYHRFKDNRLNANVNFYF